MKVVRNFETWMLIMKDPLGKSFPKTILLKICTHAVLLSSKHGQKLTKFRLSNQKLMIETVYTKKVPKEERVCEEYNLGVEDEVHFW